MARGRTLGPRGVSGAGLSSVAAAAIVPATTPQAALDRDRLLWRLTIALCLAVIAVVALAALRFGPGSIAITLLLAPALVRFNLEAARLWIKGRWRASANRPRIVAAPVPVVVPVILRDAGGIAAIEACVGDNLPFVAVRPLLLLVDLPDATAAVLPADAQLRAALAQRLAMPIARGDVALLWRARRWDPVDRTWRGWERKRGKVVELCRLAAGARDTSFAVPAGDLPDLGQFVTIDCDTRLTAGAIEVLAGVARANPGVAIVAPTIEVTRPDRPTPFQRAMVPHLASRPFEPQPSFEQGWLGRDLYHGKALIVARRFLVSVEHRIAERRVLSHDHLEAVLAGGMSTTLAVVREAAPIDARVWTRRQHRWMRGDFQLLPYLADRRIARHSRLLLAENILVHLTTPGAVIAALLGWSLLPAPAAAATTIVALVLLRPALPLLPAELALKWRRTPSRRARALLGLGWGQFAGWLVAVSHAGRDAIVALHALGITMWRLGVSGRNLLAWDDADRGGAALLWLGSAAGAVATALLLQIATPAALGMAATIGFWVVAPLLWEVGDARAA